MPNNLGTIIREAREARGFSIKDVSQKSGICRNQIVNIEIGRTKKPQYKTLQTLSKCLNLELQEMLKQSGYYEGQEIKQIRIAHCWSVATLENESGISKDTIGRIERECAVKPKIETLQALAKSLKVDYAQLLKKFGYIQDLDEFKDRQNLLEQKVSQARVLKGLTRKQLAELTGLSKAQIGNIENGKTKKPGKSTLLKIGKCLDIELV